MRSARVYIASRMTAGDQWANVGRAAEVASELLDMSVLPFVPQLTSFIHMTYPKSYDTWMEYCLAWLLTCDAVLILPGGSNGARWEVKKANAKGIPVLYSVEEVALFAAKFNEQGEDSDAS